MGRPPPPKFKRPVWNCCVHCKNGVNDPHEPKARATHLDACVFCGHTDWDAIEYEPPDEVPRQPEQGLRRQKG